MGILVQIENYASELIFSWFTFCYLHDQGHVNQCLAENLPGRLVQEKYFTVGFITPALGLDHSAYLFLQQAWMHVLVGADVRRQKGPPRLQVLK